MSFYDFARGVVKCIIKPLYRVEVIGLEHFPKEGGVLLCSNHISNLDPPSVGMSAPRPVHFMAKAELFQKSATKKLMNAINAFPVKRGMSDREALRNGLKLLKEDRVVGLFPEGKRSSTGELGKGLAGAGFFALRSNAQILPCAVIGPYKPFKKQKIVFGKPIDFTEIRKKKTSADIATEVIMAEIQKLLDEHTG
ncbi:1-acyl-sn-glycerol-3-phosphate acyltransferase [Bacillus sp. J14TS2]|uniref:lysophospholipid acyltransferase family protein n=1 Tax=unclassified Bacillus (in: firmicutes) TaxID=185979 RepID=UPI001A968B3D|nr:MULTISPECIES: lysophospholipid acyltransferase family protein [unclassified Bacillus (in: firmicutes)]MBO0994743.1 1-acyl-sn-glycerol-3-phosphate acyltransferase [Bacillus sp. SD088]GIN73440.1 1-acyl-sn-glycerol-3-phosphate acyltransferase [Bacillus sp. J14TS2]